MFLVFTQYDTQHTLYKFIQKMSQFAAPDILHIYPILIDKPNATSQSVFPVHWWTEKSKILSFRAGDLSNLTPVFSLTQDRQLRRLSTNVLINFVNTNVQTLEQIGKQLNMKESDSPILHKLSQLSVLEHLGTK